MNAEVTRIEKNMEANTFRLTLSDGSFVACDKVVIATGGRPNKSSYHWIEETGQNIESPVPSLFTFNIQDKKLSALMGLSVPLARVKISGSKFENEGPLLVTHWGMSGPVVLKLSALAARFLNEKEYHFMIRVNWVVNQGEQDLIEIFQKIRKEHPAKKMINQKAVDLPAKLWEYLLHKSGITDELRWADLPNKNRNNLVNCLLNDEYQVMGKTTFKEEFVTCGGIQLNDVNFKTMESVKVKGLYFAGEVLNIDGVTGGFNFQNAWTTGWIAAKGLASSE